MADPCERPRSYGTGFGKVYRDGLPVLIIAYFLVNEKGSDPVITRVPSIKRMQN